MIASLVARTPLNLLDLRTSDQPARHSARCGPQAVGACREKVQPRSPKGSPIRFAAFGASRVPNVGRKPRPMLNNGDAFEVNGMDRQNLAEAGTMVIARSVYVAVPKFIPWR